MSKEFEKQYRDYITEQVPDMWSRIEAGLKEKHTVDRKKSAWSERKENTVLTVREEKPVWWKHKSVTILVPAAAAVFLCLLVPAAFWGNRSKSESGATNASPAFSDEREVYEMTNGGAGTEDKKTDIADSGGMAAQDNMAEEAEMAKEEGVAEDGAASVEMAGSEVSVAEETENFRVKLRIAETVEAPGSVYDVIYAAEVLEIEEIVGDLPADSILEGTGIYFYIGEDTDITEGEIPKTGEEYGVILEPVFEEEKYFAKKIYFIP